MHAGSPGWSPIPTSAPCISAAAAAGPDEAVAAAWNRRPAARSPAVPRTPPPCLAARAVTLTPPGRAARAGPPADPVGEYRYRAEDMDGAHAALSELVAGAAAPGSCAPRRCCGSRACGRRRTGRRRPPSWPARRSPRRGAAGCGRPPSDSSRRRWSSSAPSGRPTGTPPPPCVTARTTGDPGSIAESEATLAWTRFWVGRGVQHDLLAAARAHPAWSVYAPQEATPDIVTGIVLSLADQVADARTVLRAEDRRLPELGQDRPRALVLFTLAELECRAGDLARAQWCAEEGLCVTGLVGDDFHRAFLLSARTGASPPTRGVSTTRGPTGTDAAAARGGDRVGRRAGVRPALLGFVALSAGDPATAHRHLGPICAPPAPRRGASTRGTRGSSPTTVEALVALGRTDEAQRVLAPFANRAAALDRPVGAGRRGPVPRAPARRRGRPRRGARTAVDAALAAHDRVPLPFERARTLLVAGSVQRRLRRRREARDALDEALAEFTRLGAAVWADKARAERGRIGGRAGSPLELTDAERRIAERVAAGLSNKEVAAALFLSVSTVEAALWKVYRKLDVRSRTQLAARLAERRS